MFFFSAHHESHMQFTWILGQYRWQPHCGVGTRRSAAAVGTRGVVGGASWDGCLESVRGCNCRPPVFVNRCLAFSANTSDLVVQSELRGHHQLNCTFRFSSQIQLSYIPPWPTVCPQPLWRLPPRSAVCHALGSFGHFAAPACAAQRWATAITALAG